MTAATPLSAVVDAGGAVRAAPTVDRTDRAPSARTRSTMEATCFGSTSPSYGQPKLVATITSTVPPASCTSGISPVMSWTA